jgi:hypothetical protein
MKCFGIEDTFYNPIAINYNVSHLFPQYKSIPTTRLSKVGNLTDKMGLAPLFVWH